MRRTLLTVGLRVLRTALLTAALCTAITVTTALAGGEITDAVWFGVLGALVGAASGAIAGLAASTAGAVLTRASVSARVQRWAQPLAGGVGAGSCAALVVSTPALQSALAGVGVCLIAAAAVAVSSAELRESAATP